MNEFKAVSPNHAIGLNVTVDAGGHPIYEVLYKDTVLINPSQLGLRLDTKDSLVDQFRIVNAESNFVNESWTPVYGERSLIPDCYSSLKISLEQMDSLKTMELEFRVYNEGVAFRYVIPEQSSLKSFIITKEQTQFHFPPGCFGYEEHGAEGEYERVSISQIGSLCERPLTIAYPSGIWAAIAEAGQNDYPRMLLGADSSQPDTLISELSGLVKHFVGYDNMSELDALPHEQKDALARVDAPFESPWRIILAGDSPGELLERNYLIENVSKPCEIEDTSWIKPGKLLREMTLSPQGGRDCVDFAAEHNLQYIMLDWGWYGDPFNDDSCAGNGVNDVWFFKMEEGVAYPKADIPALVRYAEARGIGVILYLDRRAVEHQIDRLLPIYKEWGVKGLKFGFVNTGPQYWSRWLTDTIKKCADYGLIVNVHDAYRPSGFSRTYPNLLTQEGIRGNEHMPTARHNCTLPFTRFIAGAGDYTICYYTDRKQTTFAHQLGMSIIAYSPLQSVLWYDKPSDYQGEWELELFKKLPTVWDETKVLMGEVGEYAVIARRSGEDWFIGAITNESARELSIPMDFLKRGRSYIAQIYRDNDVDNEPTRTNVAGERKAVGAESVLQVKMAAAGGQAIHLMMNERGEWNA
ncbi:glycoside hydrolase family 97 protein [Paenibacillus sp. HB172176]|uniref:glycoside hydrolase family 97 protein n=1 Tax=Paenibacillus sp. HB172176 TaxID=2493690 RepID=UPI0014395D81|nr:glycoside hydrolase family 97 protein [Paenibacillus sp. HB172176]